MNANIPRIQHNIVAMNAYRNYSANSKNLTSSIEKLSSGYRINRAGDDAAGLAISEKMRAQISGLTQAKKNANDGINLIQTAEGAMTEVHDMLNRMVTLAEQSANGTYSNEVDREQLQKEVESLKTEINRIADSTNYNGIKLLDGSLSASTETKTTPAEWSFKTVNIDATRTEQTLNLADKLNGSNNVLYGGEKFSLDIGLSDGTSMSVNLTANFTEDMSNQKAKLTLTDDAGNEVFTQEIANYTTEGTGAKFKAGGNIDLEDLNKGFATALSKTDLGKAYKVSYDANEGTINMKARQAGSGTVTITSLRETMYDDEGDEVTSDVLQSTKKVTQDGTATDQFADFTTTKGKDAVAAFKSSDIVLYNDSANGGKGNADEAVFTINGQKFAIGLRNGGVDGTGDKSKDNSTVKNLGDDVTFISLDVHTKTTEFGKATAATDLDNVGDAEAGEPGTFGGKDLTGTDTTTNEPKATAGAKEGLEDNDYWKANDHGLVLQDPADAMQDDDNTTAVRIDDAAVRQILSEMSKKLGVEVTYDEATWVQDPNDKTTFVSAEQEDGDAILDSAEFHRNLLQGFFKVASKVDEGTVGKSLTLQIGDTSDDYNKMSVNISDLHTKAMGIADIDISTQDGASAAMDAIKNAVNYVSDVRGGLGALQNRLDHTINNLGVMTENIQAAEGAIRDTDVAEEMMNYTKMNILNQAAQAMLAQANQLPQGVLQLIG